MYHQAIKYLSKHHEDVLSQSLEVMTILLQNEYTLNLQIVGLLLRSIELETISLDMIEKQYGKDIIGIVRQLNYGNQYSWIDRKSDIIETLQKTASVDVIAIYFADALTMLRNLYRTLEFKGIQTIKNINININNMMWFLKSIFDLSSCLSDKAMYYEFEKLFLTVSSALKQIKTSIDEFVIKTYFQKGCELEEYGPEDNIIKFRKFKYLADRYEDHESQNFTALYYERGCSVDQDLYKAVFYFQEGTVSGNMDSPYHLAKYYINGKVVKEDYVKARTLLKIAQERGCDLAEEQLAGLELAMNSKSKFVVITNIEEGLKGIEMQ